MLQEPLVSKEGVEVISMTARELRFWPLLIGVYALVWGLQASVSRLLGTPLTFTLDITATDFAIFGIVLGVWLLASAFRKQEPTSTHPNAIAV
jgi:hypothetical protein